MSLTAQDAINQAEELILDFCQELPEEEQFEREEKNLDLILEIMNQVGHAEFVTALKNDVEPPAMFDCQFYAQLGNKEVAPLLIEGLKSSDHDDVEDAVVGLCYLETEEGLVECKRALKEKRFYSNDKEEIEELFEDVLEHVSEEYKDKLLGILG